MTIESNKLVPLMNSLSIYGDRQKLRKYKEVEVPLEDTLDNLGTMFGAAFNGIFGDDDEKKKASEDMNGLKEKVPAYGPARKAREALQVDILEQLKSERLIAFGYAMPRNPEDSRAKIPRDVWMNYPDINWDANKVAGQGLEFINVIVMDTPVNTSAIDIEHQSLGVIESTKKQGRPTVRPQIVEAYEAIRDAGRIKFDAPKSALYGPICDWLAIRYPDQKNEFKALNDSTIRKAITEQFNLDRSNQTENSG